MTEIIKMLEKCDGTRKNCEGCLYEEHPLCRNAMAQHAAAQLQLDEIQLGNTAQMLAAVTNERDYLRKALETQETALGMYEQMTGRIAQNLYALKHCETCLHYQEDAEVKPEVCVSCKAGASEWLLAKHLQPDDPKAKAKPDELDELEAELKADHHADEDDEADEV